MLGAIVGDIVGSVYEFHNTKDYNFHMFTPGSRFTDDTVMTCAVAKWLTIDDSHDKNSLVDCMQELGRKYPDAGYGGRFFYWLFDDNPQPYNSWGNGSGMRVSPVGYYAKSLDDAMELAKITAEVTHNHPEGIKGAQAIASAVFLARQNTPKVEIKDYVTKTFGYDLDRTIEDIRPSYTYDVSCMGSAPEAIIAFLEGRDFEDTIRLAISIGGDSDTIGAMAGGIAQAVYGIPKSISGYCYETLTPELRKIVDDFEAKLCMKTEDPFNLERFVKAQELDYNTAYSEMEEGHKFSHWIWYIFPQLRGLGRSANSFIYGLADVEEAKSYLDHPLLGKRLRDITSVLLTHKDEDAEALMGSSIDAVKLRSCMTLFDAVSPNDIFYDVLDTFYHGKRDSRTYKHIVALT